MEGLKLSLYGLVLALDGPITGLNCSRSDKSTDHEPFKLFSKRGSNTATTTRFLHFVNSKTLWGKYADQVQRDEPDF